MRADCGDSCWFWRPGRRAYLRSECKGDPVFSAARRRLSSVRFHDASHVSRGQLKRTLATCSQWARTFREWYLRPSSSEQRGLELLREWLSREQLAQYDAHNYFEVIGCHTGKRYRIFNGLGSECRRVGRCRSAKKGWCFVPDDQLVAGDVMLAQKIALETDEQGVLAKAKNFKPRFV